MRLSFIKRFFKLGKRKPGHSRRTASTSRELDREFIDYAIRSFQRQALAAQDLKTD